MVVYTLIHNHTHSFTHILFYTNITMKYRIRLDELRNGITRLVLLDLLDEDDAMVLVRHELPHGNPHYHVYVDIPIKENALRQRFKRKLPGLESSSYSIKKCNDDRTNEYIQYLFNTKHGNKWELLDTHNIDSELIATLQKNAKEISDDFANATKSKKDKGPTIWDIAVEIESTVPLALSEKNRPTTIPDHWNKREIFLDEETRITTYTEVAISVLRKHRKPFDEYLLRRVISTAMSSSERGKELLIKKMKRNFIDYAAI